MNAVQIPPRRDPRGPSENAALRDPLARQPSRPRRRGLHLGAIGAVVREARVRKGLSQTDMAGTLSVNLRTYQSWETGRERIPPGRMSFLCGLLGLSRDEIVRVSIFAENAEEAALLLGFRAASQDKRHEALKVVSGAIHG